MSRSYLTHQTGTGEIYKIKDEAGGVFKYLKRKFPRVSDAKFKEGIFEE